MIAASLRSIGFPAFIVSPPDHAVTGGRLSTPRRYRNTGPAPRVVRKRSQILTRRHPCHRDRQHRCDHDRLAGIFFGDIHQDVRRGVTGIGIEDKVDFDALRIADDCYVVALRPARQRKPEHTVESECRGRPTPLHRRYRRAPTSLPTPSRDTATGCGAKVYRVTPAAEEPMVCRLVWEFFCQVVFWFVPVPCLERKGRSSSRRLRSGSRSARKGVKGPKC